MIVQILIANDRISWSSLKADLISGTGPLLQNPGDQLENCYQNILSSPEFLSLSLLLSTRFFSLLRFPF